MRLKFWQQARGDTCPPGEEEWPQVLQRFKEQLAVTPAEDPLLAGFLGLLDANVRAELPPSTRAGLPSEEAHRFRGRLGMLLDLKHDLVRLHEECRKKAAKG